MRLLEEIFNFIYAQFALKPILSSQKLVFLEKILYSISSVNLFIIEKGAKLNGKNNKKIGHG